MLYILVPQSFLDFGVLHFIPEAFLCFLLVNSLIYYSIKYRKQRKAISAEALSNMTKKVGLFIIFTILILILTPEHFTENIMDFRTLHATSMYISASKIIVLVFFLGMLIIFNKSPERKSIKALEFPIVVGFLALFSMITLSVNNSISLLIAIEFLTVSGIIVLTMGQPVRGNLEGCVKYFMANALGMLFIAFGFAVLYGITGTVHFTLIMQFLCWQRSMGFPDLMEGMYVFSLVCIIIGFMIKLGVAPFHQWMLDAYTGARITGFYYLTIISKFVLFCLFLRILCYLYSYVASLSGIILMIFVILSLLVGSVGGLVQHSFKRLLGYSSVFNIGLALSGICIPCYEGIMYAYIYILFYSIGLALVIMSYLVVCLKNPTKSYSVLADFAGLFSTNNVCAFGIAAGFFSLMGMPPLLGFFAKYLYLNFFVSSYNVVFAVFVIFISMIPAVYYLRIIKLMFFEGAQREFLAPLNFEQKYMAYTRLIVILFISLLVSLILWNVFYPITYEIVASLTRLA